MICILISFELGHGSFICILRTVGVEVGWSFCWMLLQNMLLPDALFKFLPHEQEYVGELINFVHLFHKVVPLDGVFVSESKIELVLESLNLCLLLFKKDKGFPLVFGGNHISQSIFDVHVQIIGTDSKTSGRHR